MTKPKATVPPVIRKGQKRPYRKATNAEIQSRIEYIARALGDKQLTKFEIHKLADDKWGVHWKTAEIYMGHARKFLLERSGKTREIVTAEAVVFNEGILRSSTTSTKEKQDARREINELFGIYPPRSFRVGDPNGKPLAPAVIAPVVNFIMPDNGRAKNNFSSNGSNNGHAETATARNGK